MDRLDEECPPGEDRGYALLDVIVKENLFDENGGDTPTFENGRWTNSIDLTITNAKGYELVDRWQAVVKNMEVNCSDHNFITFKISIKTGYRKNKFRDIAKSDWQCYHDELSRRMADTAVVF